MPSKLCKIIFEFLRGPQIQSFFSKIIFFVTPSCFQPRKLFTAKNFRFKRRVRELVRWLARERVCVSERERERVCVSERERERVCVSERERYTRKSFSVQERCLFL